ncbi:MAG TPA: PAS domain-containing protein [Azospira sp.]|nr:PAS domain-containing protein [Azospira sp.]
MLGLALAAGGVLTCQSPPRGWRKLFALLPLALLLSPLAYLWQLALPANAGHSLLALRPTTAIALFLGGGILVANHSAHTVARLVLVQVLYQLMCLVVLLGSAAQVLNAVMGLDLFLFHGMHYALDWGTAIGLLLLCAGIGIAIARTPWFRDYYRDRQDRQVLALGAALFLAMAVAAWLIGASAFAGQTMTLFRSSLLSSLSAHTQLFRNTLQQAHLSVHQSVRLSLLEELLEQGVPRSLLKVQLQNILDTGKASNLVALALLDAQGKEVATVGNRVTQQENRLPVSAQTWLFWNQGYWIETRISLGQGTALPLDLLVQKRLPELDQALEDHHFDMGDSEEIVLCGAEGEIMHCYPRRLAPQGSHRSIHQDGELLPMGHALMGRRGIGVFQDYRQQPVIAAYEALPELGLGMVEKVDIAEIHVALFHQLGYSTAVVALLMLAGVMFRQRSILPMVQAMTLTNERLREAQEIGRISNWELDLATHRITWSEEIQTIFALEPGQTTLTVAEVLARIPPEQQEAVRAGLTAAAEPGGGTFDVEHDYLLPDGQKRSVHVRGRAIRDEDGKAVMMRGVVHDITDRVRAEQRVLRREAVLAESQRIAHLGSWEWNIDEREQIWSGETYRLFGYAPRSVTAGVEAFEARVFPEDLARVWEKIHQALASHEPASYQIRIRRTDGEVRYLHCRAEVICDARNQPVRIIGTNLDVTERVLAEQQLAHMTRLYAVLSQANRAIGRATDTDTLLQAICRIAVEHGGFRLAWASPVKDGHFGRVQQWGDDRNYVSEVLAIYDQLPVREGPSARVAREGGKAICEDMATDPALAPWREAALSRGYRSSASFAVQQGDKVAAIFSLYAPEPRFFTSEIVALLEDLCRDIAFALEAQNQRELRQKAEAELRQLNEELERRVTERTRALEDANRELESFSYSVSHDLRAPLRSIDGFSQVLVRRYHDQLDDTGRDYLDRVRRASQRMGQLIDDLLELSRVTRGTLRRLPVDLSALGESVAEELQRSDSTRQVEFRIEPGLAVFGDTGLLRALLENLLGNAWKFTRHTPAPQITLGCQEQEGKTVYFVRDNGAGFDPTYAHKLFKAFQRLHAQDEYEGTGIGLATVQRIVHRHQGTLWAEGAVGQGATIYFTLPRREEASNGEGTETANPAQGIPIDRRKA